ncbi:hypothetical protein [Paraburkholderia solisilvae]|uniref:Uncharacterized protein n=1 Tax=Paraburkholderia solisilvae TaxID=624376 RepID=A0A6J5ER15_9BURK|nr:hypothetical protein [Paraburkholderia solisilvae]CAB3768613.1 hypothetical protein LMG29739_05346 [Paraburkholderia solisilvae]
MLKNCVYQIFYDDESRRALDPGFLPLDNTGQRPDWREYWPMRRFLLSNTLEENARYGFLSPKFGTKTKLTSGDVFVYLARQPDDVEVVIFSPFFEQNAIFLNVFEQAVHHHAGIAQALEMACRRIAPTCDMRHLVQSSEQVVYCNYIIATPRFWREWLAACEILFDIAEANSGMLGPLLNALVPYGDMQLPAKIFIIERMASLLLSIRAFRSRTMEIERTTLSTPDWVPHTNLLIMLDALKYAALGTGREEYVKVFDVERNLLAGTVKREREAGKELVQDVKQPNRAARRKAALGKQRK